MSEIEQIKEQLISQFDPLKIMLFGSQARGTARQDSDIDICIVADVEDKRRLLTDIYFAVEADRPIDFILYTPDEWQACVADTQSFAHKINAEGVPLYG